MQGSGNVSAVGPATGVTVNYSTWVMRILSSLILSMIAVQSRTAEFRLEEKLYVISSVASVRTHPRADAPVAGKIPIGTKVIFKGTVTNWDSKQVGECSPGPSQDTQPWACISHDRLHVDPELNWGGWINANLLGREMPLLADLIAQYDNTPRENAPERRKWAERAVALEPTSTEANRRLLEALSTGEDATALESAKNSIRAYQKTAPPTTIDAKRLFSFQNGFLEPIAKMRPGGVALQNYDQQVNYDFRKRGQFYFLYRRGRRIGTVVTETQFDCVAKPCPVGTMVRVLPLANLAKEISGIVTNYPPATASFISFVN